MRKKTRRRRDRRHWWVRIRSPRPKVDERFCPKCQQPYQKGPTPAPVADFIHGNTGAFIYPAGKWKRDGVVVRVGRWKAYRQREFYLSEYFEFEELRDLLLAIIDAYRYLKKLRAQKRRLRDRQPG
ncbi:hypothetical protein GC176_27625 [bacterium]|nr:hypothetical protein [bacterium]